MVSSRSSRVQTSSNSTPRVKYTPELLRSFRQALSTGSQTPAPLSNSPVAQADVLTHVDSNRNLSRLAGTVPKGQSTGTTSVATGAKVPQEGSPSISSPLKQPHSKKGKNEARQYQAEAAEASKQASISRIPDRVAVVRHPQTQLTKMSPQSAVNGSTATSPAPATGWKESSASTHHPINHPSPSDDQFFKWRLNIPRENAVAYRPLGHFARGLFFRTALTLVRSDPNLMQQVITLLAQEGGLRRINEVISCLGDAPFPFRKSTFTEQILPFLQIISYDRVLASAVLEAPLTKICQFLYGPNGSRALDFFTDVFGLLKSCELDPLDLGLGDATAATLYEPSILIFSKIVDLNGDAIVNDNVHRLVESVHDTLGENDDDTLFLTARKYLQRIRRRLGRVFANQNQKENKEKLQASFPKFHMIQDLPGKLSEQGPRHDNDSDDIRDIKIMPSSQEIQSDREEYLPSRDSSTWHITGLPGLLDRHFRLLREDTVGQLRDAVSVELKRMQNPEALKPRAGQQRLRTFTYHNIQFKNLLCDARGGLRFVVQFDQPSPVRSLGSITKRREWWHMAKRLDVDALVCLIDSNGSAIFCYVSGRYSNQPSKGAFVLGKAIEENLKDLAQDQNFAFATLCLVQQDAASLKEILGRLRGSPVFKNESLVEFPGVLLPSFQPTLLALRDMARTLDLPFSDLLAPESTSHTRTQQVAPPNYTMQKNFRFNLRSITNGEDLMLSTSGSSFDLQGLRDRSSLDDAQAAALVDALSRGLALIQGPPGTGKSYTGVSIIKVLLDNRKKATIGPIICVCYTNHALDQLLEQLVHSDIKNIIRIGSRSKSSMLGRFNLRTVAQTMAHTRTENKRHFETRSTLTASIKMLNQHLDGLSQINHWTTLKGFLDDRYPRHHNELFGRNEEGWQTVHHHPEQIVSNWRDGAIYTDSKLVFSSVPRSLEELRYISLHQISRAERYLLSDAWFSEIRDDVEAQIQDAYATYLEDKEEFDKLRTDLNLRCLQNTHIVGVTTSGLANNLDLLRRLPSKVVVCEEAGEVLEAHSLTTLLPSIEHAILIGDHRQLRPKIQNWDLNSENPRGEQYSLDVSLFERLVEPPIESSRLPYSTLETQRRMDPSISQLIRNTLYPNLKDSEAVENYPAVEGMKRRLFWFHHQQPEAPPDPTRLVPSSHFNEFEVDFTAALVSHLVRQGIYGEGDIAVLTLYLGQLMKLRRRLAASYEVVLGERDVEELEQAGYGTDHETDDETEDDIATEPPVEKTTLLKALRVSTVDNFQGEEAKVVVTSLVRSNKEQQCGFLRTSNRINVLLSRAKHGMYIIGNADTSYKVEMWASVIKMLDRDGNFGEYLELQCPRHPESSIYVSKPEDFHSKAPEGGCDQICKKRLRCGHACKQSCHSDLLHSAVYCMQPCPRVRAKCDHPCTELCGDSCPKKCVVVIRDVKLDCGHVRNVPCWQARDKGSVKCEKMVEKVVPSCGHTVEVKCCVDVKSPSFNCDALCRAKLSCGHNCKSPCHRCRKRLGDRILTEEHEHCKQTCGQEYSTCNHSCMQVCHEGKPCPPCITVCETICNHSKCGKPCGEPCSPCAESRCFSKCSHGNRCTLPCAAPCNWLPCEKRCEQTLSCGHRCKSEVLLLLCR